MGLINFKNNLFDMLMTMLFIYFHALLLYFEYIFNGYFRNILEMTFSFVAKHGAN